MSEAKARCSFCETEGVRYFEDRRNQCYEFSCFICGKYVISKKALATVNGLKNKYNLLNCISENIKENPRDGSLMCFWHLGDEQIKDNIDDTLISKKLDYFLPLPIIHSDKPTDILLYVAKLLDGKDPFAEVEFFKRDMLSLKINSHLELYNWLNSLSAKWLINYTEPIGPDGYPEIPENPICARIKINSSGWEKVFEKRQALKSKKVFIAMQFDWGKDLNAIKNQFVTAVKEACRECGYDADIVTEHHTEPILDKIIAGIKESHFVIADFTFNNRGTYFEAGYARALGIPVVHTVMEGHIDTKDNAEKKLHFDIQQINYIRWDSPETLKKKMVERIKAVIK